MGVGREKNLKDMEYCSLLSLINAPGYESLLAILGKYSKL